MTRIRHGYWRAPVNTRQSPANRTLQTCSRYKKKGCRWAAGDRSLARYGLHVASLPPHSFLWPLSSFPRWWFGFSLQPQTSFPSPSQPPDVVTIATVPTSAAPNNPLAGKRVHLMAPIPNQQAGGPSLLGSLWSSNRALTFRVGWGSSNWPGDL